MPLLARVPTMHLLWLVLLAVLLGGGCSGEPRRRARTDTREKSDKATLDGADQAFQDGRRMLFSLYLYDSEEGSSRCALHFNQWMEEQPGVQWQSDPMVAELPEEIRTTMLSQLDSRKVMTDDVEYMEMAVWLRDIVRWAGDTELDASLSQWIDGQATLGQDASQLRLAAKLFDWTVRNVQLSQFWPSKPEVGLQPGAGRMLRETILIGTGDPWERARVFLGLCRQAGISAVMLASVDDQQQSHPWCPAVLAGGQWYLFETQLGLPIPLADDTGIATLADARERDDVLANLSLGETLKYPVSRDDLKQVIGLVDATPEALSLRMQLIEQHLTGDSHLALTLKPSEWRQRCASHEMPIELWMLPFDALRRQRMVQRALKRDPDAAAMHQRMQALFVGTAPLIMGRKLHLHGQFRKAEDVEGAKQRYLAMRYPDQHLDALPTDRIMQSQFGLEKSVDQRDDEWYRYLLGLQSLFREAKMHASYWIGLVHFEEGNYESASQWFGKRVLEENPNSVWATGARYNLARCYERMDQIAKAREMYLEDNSPQRHGNLLRARRLKALVPDSP
ncbi:MAG: tetratricopeptide repeat protein [Planctomycetales bacterium]|nr:tetratricopeptide repeat protein [Planctomycetales bacterium]